jgi:hypothetical protein
MTFLFYFQPFLLDGYFITENERSIRFMKKMLKRLCTGFLALATVVTALPTTPVHAESKQYWTESKERVGIVENHDIIQHQILRSHLLHLTVSHYLGMRRIQHTHLIQYVLRPNLLINTD